MAFLADKGNPIHSSIQALTSSARCVRVPLVVSARVRGFSHGRINHIRTPPAAYMDAFDKFMSAGRDYSRWGLANIPQVSNVALSVAAVLLIGLLLTRLAVWRHAKRSRSCRPGNSIKGVVGILPALVAGQPATTVAASKSSMARRKQQAAGSKTARSSNSSALTAAAAADLGRPHSVQPQRTAAEAADEQQQWEDAEGDTFMLHPPPRLFSPLSDAAVREDAVHVPMRSLPVPASGGRPHGLHGGVSPSDRPEAASAENARTPFSPSCSSGGACSLDGRMSAPLPSSCTSTPPLHPRTVTRIESCSSLATSSAVTLLSSTRPSSSAAPPLQQPAPSKAKRLLATLSIGSNASAASFMTAYTSIGGGGGGGGRDWAQTDGERSSKMKRGMNKVIDGAKSIFKIGSSKVRGRRGYSSQRVRGGAGRDTFTLKG